MRLVRIFTFLLLFLFSFEILAQTPGSMTGFGEAINYRGGPTSLTSEQSDSIKRMYEFNALKDAGYSDQQIAEYAKTIEDRKALLNSGTKAKDLPKLSPEMQKMANIAYDNGTKKANGVISKMNKALYDQNKSLWDSATDWFTSKDWTGLENALDTAGAMSMGIGVGALSIALGGGFLVSAGAGVLAMITEANLLEGANSSSFGKILRSFQSIGGGSWLSPIFNMLFKATNDLAVATNTGNFAEWTVRILLLMMAFYLLFTVMKYIVSFTPIEPAKMLSEIFFPLGRLLFAVWAIKNWDWVLGNLLSPVLDLAISFGSEIMSTMDMSTASSSGSLTTGVITTAPTCTASARQALDIGVCNSIQIFLATISANLLVWMAFGATLLFDCWGKVLLIFPSWDMLTLGLILFIFTFLVYLSFPLKLLDAMFRLMFIVVLYPLWCLFWVIPQTREYFKKMVSLLINVIATFLSASIILVMVLSILSNLFDNVPLDKIIQLLAENKSSEAMKLIDFSNVQLFFAVCLLFMAFHLVSKVDYFANLFAKQDSLKIGSEMGARTTSFVTKGVPMAFGMASNATKWGAGKVKGAWEAHKAKSYNSSVPGGTARKSPRLWTAAIPGTGLWDAHKAKDQIGSYQRTQDVRATKEVAKDGSVQQTYSNKTVDKSGNVVAQMNETATSSGTKVNVGGKKVSAQQSVERNVRRFDNLGDVRRTANVKKDFENGKAVRKTTTTLNKDGTRTELSVDKKTGLATKTRFGADNKKLSSETRDRFGNHTKAKYENGRITEENTRHRDGTSTQTLHGINGDVQKLTRDAEGTVRGSSTKFADGRSQTIRYSKERGTDGKSPASFERVEKDASGKKTEHIRVDLKNDSFKDMLTGKTGKWSDRNKKP